MAAMKIILPLAGTGTLEERIATVMAAHVPDLRDAIRPHLRPRYGGAAFVESVRVQSIEWRSNPTRGVAQVVYGWRLILGCSDVDRSGFDAMPLDIEIESDRLIIDWDEPEERSPCDEL